MRWAVLALAALTLAGCETTQDRSATLERAAHSKAAVANAQGLKITSASRTITVASVRLLRTSEGAAVVVVLRNSGAAQREVPLLISAAEHGGPAVTNSEPGLARSLTSLDYVPAHATATWVDDQLTLPGTPGAVTAKPGEGKPAASPPPRILLGAQHLEQEAGGEALSGTVSNSSTVAQRELVVYAVASRNGRAVAAGRAVVPELAAGGSSKFQIFLIGASARGAKLQLSAPPSTF